MSNLVIDMRRRALASGFGDLVEEGPEWTYEELGGARSGGNDGNAPNRGGGGPWDVQLPSLIGGGLQVLRDIFAPVGTSQAAYGSTRPVYQPQYQTQYQQPPPGYERNSSGALVKQGVGNIADFISNNFLLVAGAGLGIILLFRQPPGRK